VVEGDAELFVEVTGSDLRQLLLAINIAAVDFADRGATVEPVVVEYPYDTPFGRRVVTPLDFAEPMSVAKGEFDRLLGEELAADELTALLAAMGHREVQLEDTGAEGGGERLTLRPPSYRDDLLHPVDVIEDAAISRNLNAFAPILPQDFTVGTLSAIEERCRQLREHLLGAGFQEAVTGILTSREALRHRMCLPEDHGGALIEIDNVMSANFAVLRPSQIPALLGIEAVSSKAPYPHRVFEIGEVVEAAGEENMGCRTLVMATAMLAHPKATFSELQSTLEAVAFYMGRDYELEPTSHPSFMEGRVGIIRVAGNDTGLIGEINPECLERWGIGVPTTVFEIDIEAFAPTHD
jgi:phenylalanyl-tRNA synthetase beta chain